MRRSRLSSQRGAVLIHVAIALLGLVAFSAFVVDYGVMWVSRGQAQTAADAGALAGATALSLEGSDDFDGAKAKARAIAMANLVFGEPPDVTLEDGLLNGDVTFPECPPNTPGLPDTCVKVDVYRNQLRDNPLPMFFGNLVGVGQQGVRATATAQVLTGDSTDCLKPWAVIDRWDEFGESWNIHSTFDYYSDGKGPYNGIPQENDDYVPPAGDDPGTGFRLPDDEGRRFAVKTSSPNMSSGWFMNIQLPRADGQWNGGNVVSENILTCGGLTYSVAAPGTTCPENIDQNNAAEWAAKGCYLVKPGNGVGVNDEIEVLIDKDKDAKWTGGTIGADGQPIGGRIIDSTYSPATSSPRVVPIGVMDPEEYLSKDPHGKNNAVVKLMNIYGFFIEGMGDVNPDGSMTLNPKHGKDIIGRIITLPSTGTKTSPLPSSAAFLRQVILVR